jgi:hypothetical protein
MDAPSTGCNSDGAKCDLILTTVELPFARVRLLKKNFL